MPSLSLDDFARLFGTTRMDFDEQERHWIDVGNFQYQNLDLPKRDQLICQILDRIDSGQFSVSGPEYKQRWDLGWQENLDQFIASNYDPAALTPRFIRSDNTLRLWQDYVVAEDPEFELNWYRVYRHWIFRKYLSGYQAITELGCGSCHNLIALSQMFPKSALLGLDWAAPSAKICEVAREKLGLKINGRVFNMFEPDHTILLPEGSALLALGALEQVGTQFNAILNYILQQPIAVFCHIDSMLEWYDPSNLTDAMAIRFDRCRRYLSGWIPAIQLLESCGIIEMVAQQRVPFGSLFHDGYNFSIWRKRKSSV